MPPFPNSLPPDPPDFSPSLADWTTEMVWPLNFLKSGSSFTSSCSDEDSELGEGLAGETIWFCVGWGWSVWRGRSCGCWSLEDSMEVSGLSWVISSFLSAICRLSIITISDWLSRGSRFSPLELSREGEELLRWRDVNFSCSLLIEGGGMAKPLGLGSSLWMKCTCIHWHKIQSFINEF